MSPLTKDHKNGTSRFNPSSPRRTGTFEAHKPPTPKPRKEILVQEGQRAFGSLAKRSLKLTALSWKSTFGRPLLKWIFSLKLRSPQKTQWVEDWFPFWEGQFSGAFAVEGIFDETKPVSEVHGTFQWKKTPVVKKKHGTKIRKCLFLHTDNKS